MIAGNLPNLLHFQTGGLYGAASSCTEDEKELNRQVRKDLLPQDKAEQEFTGVLKVALAAIDSDTESFETALQENKKDVSHLLGVFRRVSLKSIY